MKLAQIKAVLGATLLAGFIAPPVFAEDAGWYVGGNYGSTKATVDVDRIVESLRVKGLTTTRFSKSESDRGFKIFGGYQFNRYLAIEGGYFDLGSFDFTAHTEPQGALYGEVDLDGLNIDAVGTLPVQGRLSVFGRIGANYTEARGGFRGSGEVVVTDPSFSKRDTHLKIGLGAQWAFSDQVGMRLEAERYRVDDGIGNRGDIDLISLGLVVSLGAATADSPREASEPTRVEQYCHVLDLKFEINVHKIQRQDTEKLWALAGFLTRHPQTTVPIEGHTDEIGQERDNLLLSQRRADSVMRELVNTYGIDATRLTAIGHGEARPQADNHTEEGKRMNRRAEAAASCASDTEGLDPIPIRPTMAMQINFEQNKADIGPQYHEGLREVASLLRENPSITATVEGHTDNSTVEKSSKLSLLRAQNVVNYLAANFNIPRSRLTAEGFGTTRRIAYNTSEEGRRDNRRANIILIYPH